MSRTFRRTKATHRLSWYLSLYGEHSADASSVNVTSTDLSALSAMFHSDRGVVLMTSAPRFFRKAFEHRAKLRNDRMLRQWIENPQFDPVFENRHRHCANASWW